MLATCRQLEGVYIYRTGPAFPLGGGLEYIPIESDSGGGSGLVKTRDGFWHSINQVRTGLYNFRIISDEVLTNNDKIAVGYAKKCGAEVI